MKILFFGDVFGKPGRQALKRIIPEWKKEYKPDVILVNGENMSHGAGISAAAIRELLEAGISIITGGNHSFEGKDAQKILADPAVPILRPANMSEKLSGPGFGFFKIANGLAERKANINGANLMVINLIGQVNMRHKYDSPFTAVDKILSCFSPSHPPLPIIVDWHADASSEKMAMGWYLDGRVSAVIGTHNHIQTADEKILPKGTAFIADAGMVGAANSIIGQEINANLERFTKQISKKVDVALSPPYLINAVLIEIDEKTGKSQKITRLGKIIEEKLENF